MLLFLSLLQKKSHPMYQVVSYPPAVMNQIRGHKSGSSPYPPLRFLPSVTFSSREKFHVLSSLVDSHRTVVLLLLVCAYCSITVAPRDSMTLNNQSLTFDQRQAAIDRAINHQAAIHPTNQPSDQINKPIDRSVNQSINQSIDRSTNRLVDAPTRH